jgi:hypothetical protein
LPDIGKGHVRLPAVAGTDSPVLGHGNAVAGMDSPVADMGVLCRIHVAFRTLSLCHSFCMHTKPAHATTLAGFFMKLQLQMSTKIPELSVGEER